MSNETSWNPPGKERRLKDVTMTKNSIGYHRYIKAVPLHKRSIKLADSWCPVTPSLNQSLSWSIWNKKLKCWRKQVHLWTRLEDEEYNQVLDNPTLLLSLNPENFSQRSDPVSNQGLHPVDKGLFKSSAELAEILIFPKISHRVKFIAENPKDCLLPSQILKLQLATVEHPRPTLFVPSHYLGKAQLPGFNILNELDIINCISQTLELPGAERNTSYFQHLKKVFDFNFSGKVSLGYAGASFTGCSADYPATPAGCTDFGPPRNATAEPEEDCGTATQSKQPSGSKLIDETEAIKNEFVNLRCKQRNSALLFLDSQSSHTGTRRRF